MTPNEADTYLSDHSSIEIVERNLETSKPIKAHFLVILHDNERTIQNNLEDTGLVLYKNSTTDQYRHIALH